MKKNSIAKNVIHLFYSTALSSAINASALIVLAYYLHSYNYGLFSVVLAIAMIMGYFTDAGLSGIVLREGSKKEVDTPILMSSYIKLRFTLLLIVFIGGFLMIEIVHQNNQELVKTAYYLIIPMVTGVALQSIGTTYFQLVEKMHFFGLIRIVSAVCLLLTLSIGMAASLSPYLISFLYGFSYMMGGLFGLYLVRKHIRIPVKCRFHKGILQNIGAFTIGGFLFIILPHLGPIVLENTISLAEVGLFAVAYRIPQALQQIPFVVAGAYYPVLFRYYNQRLLVEHLKLNINQIKFMALIGMAMCVIFFHLSEFVISLLFGTDWLGAVLPLKILSVMLFLQSVNIALADGLTSRSRQNHRMTVQLIAVILGAVMYYYFSLPYGVIGAALAGVCIEILALTGFWLCNPHRVVIAKRAILPYMTFFAISVGVCSYFLNHIPLLALIINLLFIGIFMMLDKEMRGKIKEFIITKTLVDRSGINKSEGVKDGA